MFRYSLLTLMILTAILPPLIAGILFLWEGYFRVGVASMHGIAAGQIVTFKSAVKMYHRDVGQLPSSLDDLIVFPQHIERPKHSAFGPMAPTASCPHPTIFCALRDRAPRPSPALPILSTLEYN
jgi:hypothetical protein